MHKLKSVKLWLTVLSVLFAGFLNYHGTVTGEQFINFMTGALGIYTLGNVGTKAATKVKVE